MLRPLLPFFHFKIKYPRLSFFFVFKYDDVKDMFLGNDKLRKISLVVDVVKTDESESWVRAKKLITSRGGSRNFLWGADLKKLETSWG